MYNQVSKYCFKGATFSKSTSKCNQALDRVYEQLVLEGLHWGLVLSSNKGENPIYSLGVYFVYPLGQITLFSMDDTEKNLFSSIT